MIHTEHGRLTELAAVVTKDLEFVLEALGRGPSGATSRDKTLLADSPRLARFEQRARDLQDLHLLLLGMLRG
jgi:hypothetical protein